MKRILKLTPVLCILLLLALGVNMPLLVSFAVDRQMEKEIVQREDAYTSLSLAEERDFFQTLSLFHSAGSQVFLSEGYHMTTAEAEEVSKEIMMELSFSDMIYTVFEIKPVLLASKDTAGDSGVYWRCVFGSDSEVQGILWLDDQTGKMVAYRTRFFSTDLTPYSNPFHNAVIKTAEYCHQQYPVDEVKMASGILSETDSSSYAKVDVESNENYITIIKENDGRSIEVWEKSAAAIADMYNATYTMMLIRNKDGQKETYKIFMNLQNNWINFNI